MKRAWALMLLVTLGAAPAFGQANTWTLLSPTPTTMWEPGSFTDCTRQATLANPPGRAYSGIAIGDGQIYYWGGGHNGYPANDMVIYDIATNKWLSDSHQPECFHPACVVAGGTDNNYDNYPSDCSGNLIPWTLNCLIGSCVVSGGTGCSKPVFRCAGGSRNGLACATNADCSAGSVWFPGTTGTGTCNVGIPTVGQVCSTCRPFTEHSYQHAAFNPVRHKELLYAFSGTWEYDVSTRSFTWLSPPPPESADQSNRMVVWDPPRSRMLYFQTGGSNYGIYAFDYSTNAWTQVDLPPTTNQWTEVFGSWNGQVNRFVTWLGGFGWYTWDPGTPGSWVNINANAPADVKAVECGAGTNTYPCFTTGVTYDATNRRTIVLTQDAGSVLALWAYDATNNSWQKITTAGATSASAVTGYPNTLQYDAGTGSLFLIDMVGYWGGGPAGHAQVKKITLNLGNPLPTPTVANTPTITPTQPTATPTNAPIITSTPMITNTPGTPPPTPTCAGTVRRVGPGRSYTKPSQAAAAAQNGDCIYIDAGSYYGDVVHWTQSNLTIIGCDSAGNCPSGTRGDWPVLDPGGNDIASRGLWWIDGNNVTVNSFEFKCASSFRSCSGGTSPGLPCYYLNDPCPGGGTCVSIAPNCTGATLGDVNDAGIRFQGHGLTVLNSYFHDNDDGILGGANACSAGSTCRSVQTGLDCSCVTDSDCVGGTCIHGSVDIENSEFFRNGYASDGNEHNVYIGRADKLTFKYNYSHSARFGHLVKCRAAECDILYNRLTDEAGSNFIVNVGTNPPSSYFAGPSEELDIPSGGLAYVVGNVLEKAPNEVNSSYLMKYAVEVDTYKNPTLELYVSNNTFVSDCGSNCGSGGNANFIQVGDYTTALWVINNITYSSTGGNLLLVPGPGAVGAGTPTPTPMNTPYVSHNLPVNTNPLFVNQAGYDYHVQTGSPAIDAGFDPGLSGRGTSVLPTQQYVYDLQSAARPSVGALDIGAFEYTGSATPISTPTSAPTAVPTAISAPTATPAPTAAGNLMAAWAFNENAGTMTADSSGNGHTGSLVNGPTWTTGWSGSAVAFNGSNGEVDVPNFPSASSVTLEAWIYPTTQPGVVSENIILSRNDSGYDLRIMSGQLIGAISGIRLTDASFDFRAAGNNSHWYHVAYVFDGVAQTHTLYRNGVAVATGTTAGTIPAQTTDLWIGRQAQYNFGTFLGSIDEVRIYGRPLSQAEIQSDMKTPIPPPPPTLL